VLEPDSSWRRIVSLRYGAKAGVAAVVGSLALGGVAAAATGTMPGPLQDVAHFLGAPSSASATESPETHATESSSETAEPKESTSSDAASATAPTVAGTPTTPDTTLVPTTGPNPFGPAAWGLCHAFGDKTWGHEASESTPPAPTTGTTGSTTGTTGAGTGGTTTGATPTTGSDDQAGRKDDNPSVAYANLKAAAQAKNITVVEFCQAVLESHGVPSAWPNPDPTATTGTTTTGSTTPPATEEQGQHQRNGNGRAHGNGQGNGHSGDHSSGHD
jgi:hypothetical protein